ncbi:MAG TPA: ribbon-helix-helix protein, CopG family [Solirubrobacterales bacterium]|nr:ribbon-helix-helix protein, CopG family [Solirubrobacterales bacterium]
MAIVETTTIRVRRSTHERLTKEAEREGKSVTQVVEEAVELLEEQRLLEGMVRWQEEHPDGPPDESEIWDHLLEDEPQSDPRDEI